MMVSGRDDSGFLPSSLAAMVTFLQLKSVFQSRYCLFLLVLLFLGCMSVCRQLQTNLHKHLWHRWQMTPAGGWRCLSASEADWAAAMMVPSQGSGRSEEEECTILALSALKCCRASIHAGLFLNLNKRLSSTLTNFSDDTNARKRARRSRK